MIFVLDQDGNTSIPINDEALIYIEEINDNVIDRKYFLGRYFDKDNAKQTLDELNQFRAHGGSCRIRKEDEHDSNG